MWLDWGRPDDVWVSEGGHGRIGAGEMTCGSVRVVMAGLVRARGHVGQWGRSWQDWCGLDDVWVSGKTGVGWVSGGGQERSWQDWCGLDDLRSVDII